MKKAVTVALAVSIGLLGGGFFVWGICLDHRREFAHLREKALCVVELPGGSPHAQASFTTSQTIDELHVGVRPGRDGEFLSFRVSGNQGPVCSANTDTARFSWRTKIPAGNYQLSVSQPADGHGALVVVAAEKPAYLTGWQIASRTYLAALVLSALVAAVARKSTSLRVRVTSGRLFQLLLLGFVLLFLYLLFHEGGHALGEFAFGHGDLAHSDFWGIHGTPHSAGVSGPPLAPWQQAVISGGGPLFPIGMGWVLFALWRSRFGRKLRNARPMIDLYLSSLIALLTFSSIAVAGSLAGMVSDGDWRGFITNVPGPLWLIKSLLWGVIAVSALMLWQVVPRWRSLLATVFSPKPSDVAAPRRDAPL